MHIVFGWGKKKDDLAYVVSDFNVALSSSEEYGVGLGNVLPGQISVTLEIEASYKGKPAADILQFAKDQHNLAKTDGQGKIVIYPEIDVGQAIQEIEFKDAWISDISTGGSMTDKVFNVGLTITAASIKMSDVEFTDLRRKKLVTPVK
jgi:hypothetical protein